MTTPPALSIDETLAELVEEFDLLGDWEGRIEYVIELGKGLAPLDEALAWFDALEGQA